MMDNSKLVQETRINVSKISKDEILGSSILSGMLHAPELVLDNDLVVGTHPGENVPPAEVSCKLTSGERAQGLIRGLMVILQHHRAPKVVLDDFKNQALTYLDHPDEAVFFKRAKYLTVAPMAKYLRCDAPKKPDEEFRPVGHYKQWAYKRLKSFNVRNTHLWYSFLQGKRSAHPLSNELVLTTYQEHRVAMSQEDPIDVETFDLVMKELEPVLRKISKTLQKLYDTSGREAEWITRIETEHVASTKASFEKSRLRGGQLGELLSHIPQVRKLNPENHCRERVIPDLCRMQFYPRVVTNGVVRTNVMLEEYEYREGRKLWHESIRRTCVTYAEKQGTLKATIQAVLEPLKVRVISKGNAAPYYASKELQKALHTVLRRMPCFRLIGRPLCPTDLVDLAANPVPIGEGRSEWFSIDYSAATDKLSAKLSAAILDKVVDGQDEGMRNMWKAVLAPHHCKYPFPYDEIVEPVQQVNGQLMGSILSFPILCLANLGLYLANIAEDRRSLKEKLAGVLVNGDDMLYVAKRSLWDSHVALGARVGLSMSPGKAYHHPVYANANSACYHYELARAPHAAESNLRRLYPSHPRSIPFLNTGLYYGQNKVMGGSDVDVNHSYCSVINRLVQGALPGREADILKQYLHKHKTEIARETGGRSLFLPISLGGMGVEAPHGFHWYTTPSQRAMAWQILARTPYSVAAEYPLSKEHSVPIPEANKALSAPWLCSLTFREDEDLGYIIDPKEMVQSAAVRRMATRLSALEKRGKRGTWLRNDRLASARNLRFGIIPSAVRKQGTHYEYHAGKPNPEFSKDLWRDYALDCASTKLDLETPLISTPWDKLANCLSFELDLSDDSPFQLPGMGGFLDKNKCLA